MKLSTVERTNAVPNKQTTKQAEKARKNINQKWNRFLEKLSASGFRDLQLLFFLRSPKMDYSQITPNNKNESTLLKIAKLNQVKVENTHTKPQETTQYNKAQYFVRILFR